MSRFDCQEARKCLVEQTCGALSEPNREALTTHLSICDDCAEEQALMTMAVHVVQESDLPSSAPLVRQRQLAARTLPHSRRINLKPLSLVVCICSLLLLVGGVTWLTSWRSTHTSNDLPVTETPALQHDTVVVSDSPGAHTIAVTEIKHPPENDITVNDAVLPNERINSRSTMEDVGDTQSTIPNDVHDALDLGNIEGAARSALQLDASLDEGQTIDELTSLAQSQRADGQYHEACDVYGRLVDLYPDSNAADNARVAIGQMKLTAMGHPQEAISSFSDYLDRQPLGPLALDARLGIVRAQAANGTPREVIEATDPFLAFHGDAYAVSEVLVARGDALQAMGNCEDARRAYSKVLERETSTTYEFQAREGLAACETR